MESKKVVSNQSGVHDDLERVVIAHRDSLYRKPVQEHNQQAFDILRDIHELEKRPLILDSCCGTGMSSLWLARKYPEYRVVGVDQSKVRLNKATEQPDNLLLLRANCEDFWRLCVDHHVYFEKHFILYPNPWPKKAHLKRRWHGHPVFTVLPKLSGYLELRSNWSVYLEEFAFAWQVLTGQPFQPERFEPVEYTTLFEKKYHLSGQDLFRLQIEV